MMKISVCIGSACHIKGSYNVLNSLQQLREEYGLTDQVEIHAVFCLGHCSQAVAVTINDDGKIYSVSGASTREFFIQNVLPVFA